MSLDKGIVKRVAQLARLRLDDEQLEKTAEELNKIFSWIEQLDEVEVSNIEPLASVTGHSLPERIDEVTDGNYAERVLSNAPDRASNFFTVPKVVE